MYFVNISIIDILGFVDFKVISEKYVKYKLKASVEDINVFNAWQLGRIVLSGLFLWTVEVNSRQNRVWSDYD